MKRLSLYLFFVLFTFQTPSLADDISEFEIEGMSIGDSLLDYFSESEILKGVNRTPQYDRDDYKITYFQKNSKYNFKIYEGITLDYKKNDKSYKIASIGASKYYPNNFSNCLEDLKIMRKDVEESLNILPSWEGKTKLLYDKSGKSFLHGTVYNLAENGEMQITCYDYSKKLEKKEGREDELAIAISTSEYAAWHRSN